MLCGIFCRTPHPNLNSNQEKKMKRVLKEGISSEASKSDANKVKKIVEGILSDIDQRGDGAVRELSQKFDKWAPQSFRLTDKQIQECIDQAKDLPRAVHH